MTQPPLDWADANQRHLGAALAVVRSALERSAAGESGPGDAELAALAAAEGAMSSPAALQVVAAAFGLSSFEQLVLVMCAGPELDGRFAEFPPPSFGLALAALPAAHWSAVTPSAPLRRWRLVEPAAGAGPTTAVLRIDEPVLHFLAGVPCPDPRLGAYVATIPAPTDAAPSHRAVADRIAAAWQTGGGLVVHLTGGSPDAERVVAAAAAAALGLGISALSVAGLPPAPGECEAVFRLWEREARLTGCALFLDCDGLEPTDAGRWRAAERFVESATAPLVLARQERRFRGDRPTVGCEVGMPTPREQSALWRRALGGRAAELNGHIGTLTGQFNLGPRAIASAATEAAGRGAELERSLWDACRSQTRPRLDDLAQRLTAAAAWDDLVLPPDLHRALRELAAQVRHRSTVYEEWGFGRGAARGLGISALFAGPSGTGKTLAAEVIAAELRLDLYRVDLSALVSKYIGETEKNLRRVFDAAEDGGAVLLFDEADALFGKRSEVKDSHDRYANIEVSYLLQRMEAYRGLAILTTNLRESLDPAFLRRLRFVANFPFPDATQRVELWRRAFPADAPTRGLDPTRLARLNVTGGNVRNIALQAAFLAADEGVPVGMGHLARAARAEYAKLERPLSDAELGGWT